MSVGQSDSGISSFNQARVPTPWTMMIPVRERSSHAYKYFGAILIAILFSTSFISTFMRRFGEQDLGVQVQERNISKSIASSSNNNERTAPAHSTMMFPNFEEANRGRDNTVVIPYIWTSHPFWKKKMTAFCELIKDHTQQIPSSQMKSTTVLVNFTTPCFRPYEVFHLGTGNIVMAVYGLRLAAATRRVDFEFRCSDVSGTQPYREDVLPWLQGYFVAPKRKDFSRFDPPFPNTGPVCRGFGTHPLHYMTAGIRHDLRRMAVAIYGAVEGTDMDSNKGSIEPLVPNATIDNVAIHFRCGDVIHIRTDTYGIIRFDSYRKLISPHTPSIGIVTQSFDPNQNRDRDSRAVKVCHFLVEALAKYLEYHFPNATVSIRNGPEETSATAFARLVLANQTFSGLSTFSVFPAIASFGTSYIQKGGLTYFADPIAEVYPDVQMMDGPVMTSNMIAKMKTPHEMIKWLIQEDPE